MPVPSNVKIECAGQDITNRVLYSSARFEGQANAGVGTFSLSIKDVDRTSEFTTGDEVVLTLDGKRYYAGYLMQHGGTFAFPAVDTSVVTEVTTRQHNLTGVNYNVLFDRLVSYNHTDPKKVLTTASTSTLVGTLVKDLAGNHVDLPSGFNTTSRVEDIGPVEPLNTGNWDWATPGATFREQMETVNKNYGAIYYFDASKRLHLHAPESVYSRWGFSDRPNRRTVLTTHTSFSDSGATYGFREMETSQNITDMVNDALVWGGSYLEASTTPDPSGIVFARSTDPDSITKHGRWQLAENLIGDMQAGATQGQVDARAEAIVHGGKRFLVGADPTGIIRERTHPNWTVRLAWFAHDVPTMENGVKDHLTPGEIVTIILYVHGQGLTKPLIQTLPLRRVTISFPTLPSNTGGAMKTYVRFDGEFGLSLNDPFSLWEAILRSRRKVRQTVAGAGGPDQIGGPGGLWQGAPAEAPDGSRKTFTLTSDSNPIVYVAGSSQVYLNGLLLRKGADYSEGPNQGTVTMFTAPSTGSAFWVSVRLAG